MGINPSASPQVSAALNRDTDDRAREKGDVIGEPLPTRTPRAGWRLRARTTLAIIRSNPTGRVALKVTVGLLGGIVVALGLVLIPLPGPGWALVILGLAIWAIEFVWARHLLQFTRRHVQAWTRWVTRRSLPLRLAIGAVGLVFVSSVVWLSVKLSLGVDLIAVARDLLTGG